MAADGHNSLDVIPVKRDELTAQLRLGVDGAGLAGMEVSQVVALRGPRLAWLSNRLPPCWVGFRTTCQLAGASPWRGSKEASASKVLELGVPVTVLPAVQGKRCSGDGSDDRGGSA